MEETQFALQAAEVTEAEKEQADHAFAELVRSGGDPSAQKLSQGQLEAARQIFELGWAMAVRTGTCAPAVAGVPVHPKDVDAALTDARSAGVGAPYPGPAVWQKVEYKGSVRVRHGHYWVYAINIQPGVYSDLPEVRYDLCEMQGRTPVTVVSNVRASSLTALPEFLTRA
ncbi:hypothetical protein [Streptomyces humi]